MSQFTPAASLPLTLAENVFLDLPRRGLRQPPNSTAAGHLKCAIRLRRSRRSRSPSRRPASGSRTPSAARPTSRRESRPPRIRALPGGRRPPVRPSIVDVLAARDDHAARTAQLHVAVRVERGGSPVWSRTNARPSPQVTVGALHDRVAADHHLPHHRGVGRDWSELTVHHLDLSHHEVADPWRASRRARSSFGSESHSACQVQAAPGRRFR